MRSDSVFLPLSYAKCVPLVKSCPQSGICARTICKADKGRPLEDYSNSYVWIAGRCPHYLAAQAFREPPKAGPKPAHEAVEGLS